MTLSGKKVLLGVTGGIAAYKTPQLVRDLKKAGAHVQVVLSQSASRFVTKLSLSAVSGLPVYDGFEENEIGGEPLSAMRHIELARWPDLVLIAPATANCIAALAQGLANDLLTTLCLGLRSDIPLYVAPAMNKQMWEHPATLTNIKTLASRDVRLLGPGWGEQACGEIGFGRMLEPETLVVLLLEDKPPVLLDPLWQSKKIIITAGPTREAIDPVRYLSNKSSGKMGFAMAKAAQQMGAQVVLITGPVSLQTPQGVTRIDVSTAAQMQAAVLDQLAGCEVFIATAAVADYRCKTPLKNKLKKQGDLNNQDITLTLTPNPDILATVASLPEKPFCIGFAAETEHHERNAKIKLTQKKIDMIVLNDVMQPGVGFDVDTNQVTVYWPGGQHELALASKDEIAKALLLLIGEHYYAENRAKNTG